MASKNLSKGFEDKLIEKFSKEIEDQAKDSGKKALESKVEENLSKFDEKSDSHVKGIREKMKRGFAKYKLNLHATVLLLLCLQLLVSFFLLFLLFFFSFILTLILIWILMFVGCIYCGSYCLIVRFPKHFRKSSSSFIMCFILAICEGIVLCFMAMPISTKVFLLEVSMIIVSLFMAALMAKCLKNKYKASSGLMMALLTTASMFIIFFFTISSVRLWLTACTLLVCGYEWFLIFKVSSIIKELEEKEEDDTFQTGLFASLLTFKAKIDLFVMLGKIITAKCCKPKVQPENVDV